MLTSIWGDAFVIEDTKTKAKTIKNKIAKTKEVSIEKKIASKTTSISEKLELIKAEVYRILGVYKENTICLRDKESFIRYIDKAIQNGVIAIDTETNNSLDPISCKLMGACIYTPGEKNAYIPINHTDLESNLLSNQLTESDIKEQFARLRDTKIIMHNAKFDQEVIYYTCGIMLHCDWDTLLGAQILNENELANLKYQYINKIDPSIEKYDIEHLFNVEYKYVSPELFALYAATDSFMTYKLYLWQKDKFELPLNNRLYKNIFLDREMASSPVFRDMELTGVDLDEEYCKRLVPKYHKLVDDKYKEVFTELHKYDLLVAEWRTSASANEKPKQYATADETVKLNQWYTKVINLPENAQYEALKKLSKKYPDKDSSGYYKLGKSKAEQLSDPIEITSPIQLAILLYDILQVPVVDKKNPRGTGEPILEQIDEPFCDLLIEYKKFLKLVTAFIDTLPDMRSEKDNKIHPNYKLLGASTGRISTSNPNLQLIPSKNHELRMMFVAPTVEESVQFDDYFEAYNTSEIKLNNGAFVLVKNIEVGTMLENQLCVKAIYELPNNYRRISCEQMTMPIC